MVFKKHLKTGQSILEYFILLSVIAGLTIVSFGGKGFLESLRNSQYEFVSKASDLITHTEPEPFCGDNDCNGNEQPLNVDNKGPNDCLVDCGILGWSAGQQCNYCDSFPKSHPTYRPCRSATSGEDCSQNWRCGNGYCEPGETMAYCGKANFEKDCTSSCFLEGTKITLADGSGRNIEEIKIGDPVLGYKDHKFPPVKVRKIFRHRQVKGYFVITTSDNQTIRVTGEHPVFVGKDYKKVRQLKLTDMLFFVKDNRLQPVKIKSIEFKRELADVYNLKVGKTHNFFAEGILFHNK